MLHSLLLLKPFARVPDSPSLFDSIEIFPNSLISVKAMQSLIRHSLANSIFSPNDFFGQWFEERYEKLPARRIRLIQEKPAALMAEDSDVVRRGDYAALRLRARGGSRSPAFGQEPDSEAASGWARPTACGCLPAGISVVRATLPEEG